MRDLAFYEQEYGNACVTPGATDEQILDHAEMCRRAIEAKWPDGVWTVEPHIIESPPLPGMSWRPRGWYGVFAPQGVLDIPETANA